MEIGLSIFPVIFFLAFLFLLDSFKLVVKKYLLSAILWGASSAIIAYFINTFFIEQVKLNFVILSNYLAPANEEILKALMQLFALIIKQAF